MARGQRCPSCGKLRFQEQGLSRTCSGCGAVGWIGGEGPSKDSKRGRKCGTCGTSTLKKIGDNGSIKIHHCFTCAATYVE